MNVTFKNGQVSFRLIEMLEHLTSEELCEVADALSCMDAIIENVAAQIVDGWTEFGSHGGRGYAIEPFTALDKAVRRISLAASDIAAKDIEQLTATALRHEQSCNEAWERVRKLEEKIHLNAGTMF